MKRLLLAATLSLLAATSAAAQTVILVRHAEKADQTSDPILSTPGEERARALAADLPDASVDFVIVTPLQRTRMTAAPTAAANGVTPTEIGFDGGAAAHVAAVVERVRAQPADSTVLVVGHSNTIPLIARGLGAQSADMADCEYDRLTIVVLGDGSPVTINGRYGQPSTCE
jgi:broad specificity phosphatase PhoE